jgi:undecaprenol kinase
MNWQKFIRSFDYAFNGLSAFIRKEQNIKVQLVIGIMVVLASFVWEMNWAYRLIILFLAFLIPGLEIVNGLVEEIADLLQLPYHRTTYLRNLSAGLVLWFGFLAAIIGILLFLQAIN